ncbi:UDP-glycosyltransferase 82A1 [Apium graveolens]|uniref:UDP-glycosyltransferase 82A1 n=1 Tax=Apium graveolens TaxID=4045 RepID=UPI003D7A6D2A
MTNKKRPKILLVPYPAQGHVTPIINLASVLARQSFKPVIVTTEFIHRSISHQIGSGTEISLIGIPDEIEEGSPRDFFAVERAMENIMPKYLEKLVEKSRKEEEDGGGVIACFVVDLLASWAIKVGCQCGIPVAGFWPAMVETYHLIKAIPDMIRTGFISNTGIPQCQGPMFAKSEEPSLSSEDLPWLIGTSAERQSRFNFWTRTLDRSRSLEWLLVTSYPDNYCDKTKQLKLINTNDVCDDYPQILPAGFTHDDHRSRNVSFLEEDHSCLDWLDKQKDGSVLYISFGSWVSPIEETKVKRLALALEALTQPFIWVLGANWRNGLPAGYIEKVSQFGQIVSWAPQLKVLQHKAVRYYLTHCGWNSTLEAIQCQKRMLCYPLAGDQFLNCKYVVQVWRVGIRLNGFEYQDLETGIQKLMKEETMDKRLVEMKERMMGKEARFRMMNNVATFTNSILKNL